jgi:hypothetical protein
MLGLLQNVQIASFLSAIIGLFSSCDALPRAVERTIRALANGDAKRFQRTLHVCYSYSYSDCALDRVCDVSEQLEFLDVNKKQITEFISKLRNKSNDTSLAHAGYRGTLRLFYGLIRLKRFVSRFPRELCN